MTHMDAKATPTNNTDYRCYNYKSHITYLTNHNGYISHHITPLVINSLGGGHTHAYRHPHRKILRNQMCVGCQLSGLKIKRES